MASSEFTTLEAFFASVPDYHQRFSLEYNALTGVWTANFYALDGNWQSCTSLVAENAIQLLLVDMAQHAIQYRMRVTVPADGQQIAIGDSWVLPGESVLFERVYGSDYKRVENQDDAV